jgi:hypothetical protein
MEINREQYLKEMKSKLLAIEDDKEFLIALNNLPYEDVSDIIFVDCPSDEIFPEDLAERFHKMGDDNRKKLMDEIKNNKREGVN